MFIFRHRDLIGSRIPEYDSRKVVRKNKKEKFNLCCKYNSQFLRQLRWLKREIKNNSKNKGYILSLLIKYSKVIVKHKVSKQQIIEKRTRFNSVKHKYIDLNDSCVSCKEKAEARHHIVPLINGGTNTSENIVILCNKCHAMIHPWLEYKTNGYG